MAIELYKTIKIIKDVQTKSSPSSFIPKDTIGVVLEYEIDENGGIDYLVELKVKNETIVDYVHEDELEEYIK